MSVKIDNEASKHLPRRQILPIDHVDPTAVDLPGSGDVGEQKKYNAFGSARDGEIDTTDRQYTGQKLDTTGLMYYNARYYDPAIGQFISPDTIVPDPANVLDYNRYMYVRGNPIKYNDPSGHCVFGLDTMVCVAALLTGVAFGLTSDIAQPPPEPRVYPSNANGETLCDSSLSDCFGDTVFLKDFSTRGEGNPISINEFEAFTDKIAADLHSHDLDWPGYFGGRGAYDTPFYNGGQSERRSDDPNATAGLWPSDQQVCIETLGCSGRSEINYIAQGMWGAAVGEPKPITEGMVRLWKGWEYFEKPSENTLFWMQYGYDYYTQWQEAQDASNSE